MYFQDGAVFRADSVVSSETVVTVSVEHQSAYTFKNTGSNPIHFRINQVNTKATIESCDEGVEV